MPSQKPNIDRIVKEMGANCLAMRIRRLNRVVTSIYEDHMHEFPVTASQVNILVATAHFGIARPKDVCEVLEMDVSTLSRNLERMKDRDWIEIVPDAEDARAQPFRITSGGRRLLQELYPCWKDAQREVEQTLGQTLTLALLEG